MVEFSPKAVATVLAVIAVLAVLGFALHFTGGPAATGRVVEGTGSCVILPNQKAPVEKLGLGIVNSDHVCDAATNGCAYCMAQCELFNKIVDKYGCSAEDGVSGTFTLSVAGVVFSSDEMTITSDVGSGVDTEEVHLADGSVRFIPYDDDIRTLADNQFRRLKEIEIQVLADEGDPVSVTWDSEKNSDDDTLIARCWTYSEGTGETSPLMTLIEGYNVLYVSTMPDEHVDVTCEIYVLTGGGLSM